MGDLQYIFILYLLLNLFSSVQKVCKCLEFLTQISASCVYLNRGGFPIEIFLSCL